MKENIFICAFPVFAYLLAILVANILMFFLPEYADFLAFTANPFHDTKALPMILTYQAAVACLPLLFWFGWPNLFTGIMLLLTFQAASAQGVLFLLLHT